MEKRLFSCRNCIHNGSQSLYLGTGLGYCLKYKTLLFDSVSTTCSYLYRKDIPKYLAGDFFKEHVREYWEYKHPVDIDSKENIKIKAYSEKVAWESGKFDKTIDYVLKVEKAHPKWNHISTMLHSMGGFEFYSGTCLARRYTNRCGTWTSSYRLVLYIINNIDTNFCINKADLIHSDITEHTVQNDILLNSIVYLLEFANIADFPSFEQQLNKIIYDVYDDPERKSINKKLEASKNELKTMVIQFVDENRRFFVEM